jgi:hypothetical protein
MENDMSIYDDLLKDDDEEITDGGMPDPVDTIAGPMTPNKVVMERITQRRQGITDPEESEPITSPSSNDLAAMEYAHGAQQDASIGRTLNAVASGFGAKVDNSGYDEMVKNASNTSNKMMDRSSKVAQAIAARGLKERQMTENERHNRAVEDAMQKRAGATASLARSERERKAEEKETARQDRLDKDAKLSDKQIADIGSQNSALKSIDDVLEQKKNWDTGLLSFTQNKLLGMVGMDDSKKSAFKSDVGDQLAQYIKNISGASVSASERAALLENMPSVYDNDATFVEKAMSLKKRLARIRETELDALEKGGKNVTAFKTQSPPADPPPAGGGGVPGVASAHAGEKPAKTFRKQGSPVSTQEVKDYAVSHKMTEAAAKEWLESQGYAVN